MRFRPPIHNGSVFSTAQDAVYICKVLVLHTAPSSLSFEIRPSTSSTSLPLAELAAL